MYLLIRRKIERRIIKIFRTRKNSIGSRCPRYQVICRRVIVLQHEYPITQLSREKVVCSPAGVVQKSSSGFCHTQSVKRIIKLATEAASIKVCKNVKKKFLKTISKIRVFRQKFKLLATQRNDSFKNSNFTRLIFSWIGNCLLLFWKNLKKFKNEPPHCTIAHAFEKNLASG